jgi:hypothetical protein
VIADCTMAINVKARKAVGESLMQTSCDADQGQNTDRWPSTFLMAPGQQYDPYRATLRVLYSLDLGVHAIYDSFKWRFLTCLPSLNNRAAGA